MELSVSFKRGDVKITFEPLDDDNEMEVRTEGCGVEICAYLTTDDMISLGGHLLRAGKKLANAKG